MFLFRGASSGRIQFITTVECAPPQLFESQRHPIACTAMFVITAAGIATAPLWWGRL